MKMTQRVRGIWKTVGVLFCVFISLAFIITFGCMKIEYGSYISAYSRTQIAEKKSLTYKADLLFREIKSYLILAQTRIESALKSQEEVQRIVISMTHLSIQGYPFFLQKATYHSTSSPQVVLSRLGPIKLDTNSPSNQYVPGVFFLPNEQDLVGQIGIKNGSVVGGILTIQLSMADVLAFLGSVTTLQLQKNPFDSNLKLITVDQSPSSFREFAKIHWRHYGAFGCLTLALILGLVVGIFIIYRRVQLNHKDHMESLEDSLRKSEKQLDELSLELIDNTMRIGSLEKVSKAQQQIQEQYSLRLRERAKIIELSLDALHQSFISPALNITEREEEEIIAECLTEAKALAMGVWNVVNEAPLDFKKMIEKVLKLFEDTVAKMEISLSIEGNITLTGDALFMEFLLMNFIGKAIHRLHKNGKIEIIMSMGEDGSHLSLKDDGFLVTGNWEKIFKTPFLLYANDDRFRNICRRNGLIYQFESQGGSNISSVIFPIKDRELGNIDKENVVQLFKN